MWLAIILQLVSVVILPGYVSSYGNGHQNIVGGTHQQITNYPPAVSNEYQQTSYHSPAISTGYQQTTSYHPPAISSGYQQVTNYHPAGVVNTGYKEVTNYQPPAVINGRHQQITSGHQQITKLQPAPVGVSNGYQQVTNYHTPAVEEGISERNSRMSVSWQRGMVSDVAGVCPDGSTPANKPGWCIIRDRYKVKQYLISRYGANVSGMTHSSGSTEVRVPEVDHSFSTNGGRSVIEKAVTVKGEKINVEVKGRRVTMIRGKCPDGSVPAHGITGWCDIQDPGLVEVWFKTKYGLTVNLAAAIGGTIDIRVVGNMINRIKGECPPGSFPSRAKQDFCIMSDKGIIESWLLKQYGINLSISRAVEKSAPNNQVNIEIEGDLISRVFNACPEGTHPASERPGWCKVVDWVRVHQWLQSNYGVTFDMRQVRPLHRSFEVINGLIDPVYGSCPAGSLPLGIKCRVLDPSRLKVGIVDILSRYESQRPMANKKIVLKLPEKQSSSAESSDAQPPPPPPPQPQEPQQPPQPQQPGITAPKAPDNGPKTDQKSEVEKLNATKSSTTTKETS